MSTVIMSLQQDFMGVKKLECAFLGNIFLILKNLPRKRFSHNLSYFEGIFSSFHSNNVVYFQPISFADSDGSLFVPRNVFGIMTRPGVLTGLQKLYIKFPGSQLQNRT